METPAHFFDWLLTASARASLLTVVVLIVQVLLGHRAPARWRYALWLPVLLVLLTPAFPESQWSVGSIVRTAPEPLPVPVMVAQEPALNVAPSAVGATETPSPISWSQIMLPAWLLGAAGMIVICIISYALTLWRIKQNRVPVNDALRHEIAALARGIGLRRAPRVWMATAIRIPAVTGFLHPTLLLPAQFDESLTAQEARLVLRHELTHLKRGDLPLNALLCLLLALHWFNPLLWLAFFKVRLDREAACDAQVLDHEPQSERVAYGHTLLRVETAFSHHGLSLGFVGIFQRGSALRSRIQSIATPPTQTVTMKTTLSLCILLLTFLGITKAAPPDKNAPQVLIEAKFIEVNDSALDVLAPFAATGASPSVAGVLNDGQLSALLKKIEKARGVDILSMPRLTAVSGQEAKIEVGREFAYQDTEGKLATKQLGTTLTVIANKGGENDIDLELKPQIVGFEGLIKDEKTGVEQPVFNERFPSAGTLVTVTSGQTVVLGFPPTSSMQTIIDSSPEGVFTRTENITSHTILFVTACLVDPDTGKSVDPEPTAEKNQVQSKLDTIILPSVVFADATVSEAVEFLRRKSLDLDTITTDPNQKGVKIIFKAGGNTAEARITLDLKNIPLGEALKYVAQLSNLHFVVERYAVTLISQADFEARQKQVESSAPNKPGPVITAESISIDIVPGVVDAGADVKIKTSLGTISTEQAKVKTKPSAGEVLLPKVLFQDATLTEAVEFLRIKSRELDPEKKGLNILVKPGGDTKAKITMQLKDVPIYEALRYVAEISGCNLTVEGDVFVITSVRNERK